MPVRPLLHPLAAGAAVAVAGIAATIWIAHDVARTWPAVGLALIVAGAATGLANSGST